MVVVYFNYDLYVPQTEKQNTILIMMYTCYRASKTLFYYNLYVSHSE